MDAIGCGLDIAEPRPGFTRSVLVEQDDGVDRDWFFDFGRILDAASVSPLWRQPRVHDFVASIAYV